MDKTGKMVVLVREETNEEDVEVCAAKVSDRRGGMTSHAALARG
jgi:phosphoenolpyruvate synthase/pyruvate phosphate dikinase